MLKGNDIREKCEIWMYRKELEMTTKFQRNFLSFLKFESQMFKTSKCVLWDL